MIRAAFLLAILVAAPARAAQPVYFKMVVTKDAVKMKPGKILRPRFAKQLLRDNFPIQVGKKTSYLGGATERLFAKTLAALKKAGKVDPYLPGRTDGVFVTTDLDRFPQFRDDPTRTKLQLAPVDEARVGTYDRRHVVKAVRLLERALRARGAEQQRLLALAGRAAERYYTEAPDHRDPKAEPETLLGGGARVVKVTRR